MTCQVNRKRSDVEISADILKVARNDVKKSHLVYRTNLNFKLVDKYLEILNRNELIEGPSNKKTFKTTEKGLQYLKHYDGFQQYITKSDN